MNSRTLPGATNMDEDVLDGAHRNRTCYQSRMFTEGLCAVGSKARSSLTHIMLKRTTLLPCEYQFEEVIFRKTMVLEGANGSLSLWRTTSRKHTRYGTSRWHP